jgi:hypothetical protein
MDSGGGLVETWIPDGGFGHLLAIQNFVYY